MQVVPFTVLYFKWSVDKLCVAKKLLAIWETFLDESIYGYSPYKFIYKFALVTLFSIRKNQKQESFSRQVGGLVTRNISGFCLKQVTLYFKGMPNSVDF